MNRPSNFYYKFSSFYIDVERKVLFNKKKRVDIPAQAIEVLIVLVKNKGHLFTLQELIKEAWGENVVIEEANIYKHICTLRKALGENSKEGKYIETVPRRGYRFVARLREASNTELKQLGLVNLNEFKEEIKNQIRVRDEAAMAEKTYFRYRDIPTPLIYSPELINHLENRYNLQGS